ncbi:MAG: 16S rRNA (uracil(1498)-N(3))-methyltransferase [Fibrobacterota bacterium]
MNILILKPDDEISPGNYHVDDDRSIHIQKYLRGQTGTTVHAGILNGPLGYARIIDINTAGLTLGFSRTERTLPSPLPVTLFCALPRPQTFKKIVYDATVMGVKHMHFFHSRKVEKSYWHSPVLTTPKISALCQSALSQACDTILPHISFHTRFRPFAEDLLSDLTTNTRVYVFHPHPPSGQFHISKNTDYSFIVGPEGGFTEYETDLLQKNSQADAVSLGARILRVEQAVSAILGYSIIQIA